MNRAFSFLKHSWSECSSTVTAGRLLGRPRYAPAFYLGGAMNSTEIILLEIVESLQAVGNRMDEIQGLVDQGRFEGIRGLVWATKKICRDCVVNLTDTFWSMSKQPPAPPDELYFQDDPGGQPAYEFEIGRQMAAEQMELRWR